MLTDTDYIWAWLTQIHSGCCSSFTIFQHLAIWGNLVAFYAINWIVSSIPTSGMYTTMFRLCEQPSYWITMIVSHLLHSIVYLLLLLIYTTSLQCHTRLNTTIACYSSITNCIILSDCLNSLMYVLTKRLISISAYCSNRNVPCSGTEVLEIHV